MKKSILIISMFAAWGVGDVLASSVDFACPSADTKELQDILSIKGDFKVNNNEKQNIEGQEWVVEYRSKGEAKKAPLNLIEMQLMRDHPESQDVKLICVYTSADIYGGYADFGRDPNKPGNLKMLEDDKIAISRKATYMPLSFSYSKLLDKAGNPVKIKVKREQTSVLVKPDGETFKVLPSDLLLRVTAKEGVEAEKKAKDVIKN